MKDLATLTSELQALGIRLSFYSQGVGCKDGVSYLSANDTHGEPIACWCWHEGLNFNTDVPSKVTSLIRQHCKLYANGK